MNVENKIKYSTGYIITKDKDENDLIDAKEYFEKPEVFLSINPKISIGVSPYKKELNHNNNIKIKSLSSLKLKNSKRDNKDNLISLSKNNSINNTSKLLINNPITKTEESKRRFSIFSLKEKIKKNNNTNNKLNIKNMNIINKKKYLTLESKDNVESIHYHYTTLKDLKKIFRDSIERENHFKSQGTNDLIPIKTDSNIKKSYFSQEKRLKFNQTTKSNEEKYFKYLAKKCNKKENELLINTIEEYRMKKQIKEYVEKNKNLSERFGNNYWLFNLRRPAKNDFIRLNYVNIGNNNREIWKRFVDYPDKDIELINDPYNKIKNKINILYNSNKFFKDTINKMPNIKGIDDIKIEGKNLVKKELKDIDDINESNKNNCLFRLYMDPIEKNKNSINDFTCKELYNTKRFKKVKKSCDFLDKKKSNYRYYSKLLNKLKKNK